MRIVQRVMHVSRLTVIPRRPRRAIGIAVLSALLLAVVSTSAGAARSALESAHTTPAPINGTGSSFASPAIDTWVNATHGAPYNLGISWSPSNSGTGRYEFTNQTTDFAVSDIGYVGNTDTTPPSFSFNFIPITAGGIAFMYNVPGLSKQLQLSSLTACGLLTGGIKNWNDPNIAADNPGVNLPNIPVIPVTESDSAGNKLRARGMVHRRAIAIVGGVRAGTTVSVGRTHGWCSHLRDRPQLELARNQRRAGRPVHHCGGQ